MRQGRVGAHDAAISTRAQGVRALALEQTLLQGGGYLGQACSSAEILAVLFGSVLKLAPSTAPPTPSPFTGTPGSANPSPSGGRYLGAQGPDTDRLIVSPAHYAMALYAALITDGRLDRGALSQFNTDGSTLEMIGAEHSPGCELTTGSFGQALSQAAGIAWARRVRGDQGRVFTFLSDGEMQEGQTWEAFQFLAFHRIDNLVVVVDVNGQQVDGRMQNVMAVEPLADRMQAFGADVVSVDGHSVAELRVALERRPTGRPLVVLAYTHPTTGLAVLEERTPRLHYIRVRGDEDRAVLTQELARLKTEAGM